MHVQTYPRLSASPKVNASKLPSCLQAVSALLLLNPSIHIVPHWLSMNTSNLPEAPSANDPPNRRSPCCASPRR